MDSAAQPMAPYQILEARALRAIANDEEMGCRNVRMQRTECVDKAVEVFDTIKTGCGADHECGVRDGQASSHLQPIRVSGHGAGFDGVVNDIDTIGGKSFS